MLPAATDVAHGLPLVDPDRSRYSASAAETGRGRAAGSRAAPSSSAALPTARARCRRWSRLPNGGELSFTWSRADLPSGIDLRGRGVTSDRLHQRRSTSPIPDAHGPRCWRGWRRPGEQETDPGCPAERRDGRRRSGSRPPADRRPGALTPPCSAASRWWPRSRRQRRLDRRRQHAYRAVPSGVPSGARQIDASRGWPSPIRF